MKILRNESWKEFQEYCHRFYRIVEAHRWLSEFDPWLNPLWRYWNGEIQIETAREEIRKAFIRVVPHMRPDGTIAPLPRGDE